MDTRGDEGFSIISESHSGQVRSQFERHLAYFAHAPLAVMVVDAAGRFIEVNPAACRLTGYEEAELLAMSVTDLLAEESREAGLEHFARVKEAGHASGEFAAIRKDGSKRWVTCDAVKLSEDRFIAFKLDMTDRRNTEEALRRSQSELRAIHDHSPLMMCVIDSERQVLYCNRALSSFVGKPEEELKGDRACGILGCVNALDDPRGCGYGPTCASCSLRVAILDTIGELARVYAVSTVSFVGNSLVQGGGHNILQPVALGKPALFGPHMENFRDIAAICKREEVGIEVANPDELIAETDRLLNSEGDLTLIAARGPAVIDKYSGASERNAQRIIDLLEQHHPELRGPAEPDERREE